MVLKMTQSYDHNDIVTLNNSDFAGKKPALMLYINIDTDVKSMFNGTHQ